MSLNPNSESGWGKQLDWLDVAFLDLILCKFIGGLFLRVFIDQLHTISYLLLPCYRRQAVTYTKDTELLKSLEKVY